MQCAHGVALPTGLHRLVNQGQGVGPGGQHHQLAVALLNFTAANFQQTRHVQRLLARCFSGQHAQHHHLQRDHAHFQFGDLIPEAHIVVNAFRLGDAFQALQLALGAVHIGNVGALVAQQVLGVSPAFVFFANQVVGGDFDVVKKDLIDLGLAIQQHDGAHGDAGRFHVDQQKADAGLGLAL